MAGRAAERRRAEERVCSGVPSAISPGPRPRAALEPWPTVAQRARLAARETTTMPSLCSAASAAASEKTLTTPPATQGRLVACISGGNEKHRNSTMLAAEYYPHDNIKPRRPLSIAPFSISLRTSLSVYSIGSCHAATSTASTSPVGVRDAKGAHDTGCSMSENRAHAPGGHPRPPSADPLESETTSTSSVLSTLTPFLAAHGRRAASRWTL